MSQKPDQDPRVLPAGLACPQDDGGCEHLGRGAFDCVAPEVALMSTDGRMRRLAEVCDAPTVVFFYPRTGVPGQPPNAGFNGEDWNEIPGARGCTPQSCGFGDLHAEFTRRGVKVLGISTNTTEHQREFKARTGLAFELLSDSDLRLTRAMALPTFEFPVESGGPNTLLKRMAWFVEPDEDGAARIRKVWYPVFPANENARVVLDWVDRRQQRREHVEACARVRSTEVPGRLVVRPIRQTERELQSALFTKHFGGTRVSSRGVWLETAELPTLVCEHESECGAMLAGIVSHTEPIGGGECEVVALVARVRNVGAGSALLRACERVARAAGSRRLVLTTSNDNVDALRFYQRRGWRIVRVYPGVLTAARLQKAEIPKYARNGIEICDDLELELPIA